MKVNTKVKAGVDMFDAFDFNVPATQSVAITSRRKRN